MKLGINGLGRIGKLLLRHQCARDNFSEIVVNTGRDIGQGLTDIAACIEQDSTYGRLDYYLHGHKGGRAIEELDEQAGTMLINGVPVRILKESRNPKDIKWRGNNVRLVVDTTGAFNDPTADIDAPRGACRGHLVAGADKVILSAPFRVKAKGIAVPEDAVTLVAGINDEDYLPGKHNLISAASCTTTCLAYMIKPLMDAIGAARFLSASMVTVHAATGSQQVLDRLPGTRAKDRRKNRSILNNIILTTTGAARTLGRVIPEMKAIGFMAESVRVPITTGSLIILVLNLQDNPDAPIKKDLVNSIYRDFAAQSPYLEYTEEQHVSSDIIGMPAAAAIIEASETHTRTGMIRVHPDQAAHPDQGNQGMEVPVTQTVIYGWYDNELGSYTNMLAEQVSSVADSMRHQ